MCWRQKLRGFYAILDSDSEVLARLLVAPDAAGATVLQLRLKPEVGVTTEEFLRVAHMARRVTSEFGALFIVNDRLDVALASGADGVHLGQGDLPLSAARAVISGRGEDLLIGISTHDAEQARAAAEQGADYLGFGPVYATRTKANPDPVQGVDVLRDAVTAAGHVPVVAIGGVEPVHGPALAKVGACAACAISAVNRSSDPAAAGRLLGSAWAPVAS